MQREMRDPLFCVYSIFLWIWCSDPTFGFGYLALGNFAKLANDLPLKIVSNPVNNTVLVTNYGTIQEVFGGMQMGLCNVQNGVLFLNLWLSSAPPSHRIWKGVCAVALFTYFCIRSKIALKSNLPVGL